jgi:hypothetical protein
MESDQMKKALQSRRGKGIDVSIILGPHEPEEEKKNTDLAPNPGHPLDVDQPAGVQPPMPQDHSALMDMQHGDLLHGMSDYDKGQSATHAPRSLGERARKEMILASQKK